MMLPPPHGTVGVGSRHLGLTKVWLDFMVIDLHGRRIRLWVLRLHGRRLGLDLGLPPMVANLDEVFEEDVGHSVPWRWRLACQGGLAGFLSEACAKLTV